MVPPNSHRISRVPWYLGIPPREPSSFTLQGSHPLRPAFPGCSVRRKVCNSLGPPYRTLAGPHDPAPTTDTAFNIGTVWAVPFSLAATGGISVDFSSSGYLDVSIPPVRLPTLWIQAGMMPDKRHRVSPFGNPRINACVRLPEAYRSLPRPSSPAGAKASTAYP